MSTAAMTMTARLLDYHSSFLYYAMHVFEQFLGLV